MIAGSAVRPVHAIIDQAEEIEARSLDRRIVAYADSNEYRRLVHVLNTMLEVAQGLKVNEKMIARRLAEDLPFVATENILMEAVNAGGDRQELHEQIRVHALAAAELVKAGEPNDLIDRIRADAAFATIHERLDEILAPRHFIGRAPEQVDEFLAEMVRPELDRYRELLGFEAKTLV